MLKLDQCSDTVCDFRMLMQGQVENLGCFHGIFVIESIIYIVAHKDKRIGKFLFVFFPQFWQSHFIHILPNNTFALFLLHIVFLFLSDSFFLCLTLTEHIGKKCSCQMTLVLLRILGHPHTLPLLGRDTTGLHLLSVDGCGTQHAIFFGLEDRHTLNAVHVNILCFGAEQIDLKVGLLLGQDAIFMRQLHAYILYIVE